MVSRTKNPACGKCAECQPSGIHKMLQDVSKELGSRRSRYSWLVICNVTSEFQNSIVFGVESHGVCLTLSRPPPRNSVTNQQPVKAGTWPKSTTKVCAVAAPEEPDNSRENVTLAEGQSNKKHKTMRDTPYSLVDCGGEGNCGWTCVS